MDPKTTESRNPVESIASEYADAVRQGKNLSVDAIAEANPEHESELRELLPLITHLERARQTQQQRPAGLATLGASRPEQLGDFQLVRQIGRGGMGVVFEAVQQSLGRRVALKVLPKTLLSNDEQLRRFEHEARTAAALHHTNIVPVFGVGQDHGFHYFVMQRIDGHGLDALLENSSVVLTPRQVAKLGVQAASALDYAHDQQVLHRDIKPANLLVNDRLDLWITDFGVAKALEAEAVTRTGDVVGTLRYMAPEQVVGEADIRSDIYSLGVTLYELLAGRPAVDDSSIRQAIVARRPISSPPPLRQLNPEVPVDLETILQTAMSNDPAARYQNAGVFQQDLEAFLSGNAISVRRVPLHERIQRWGKRNPAVAVLSALSLLLLASVAALSTAGVFQLRAAFEREQQNRQKAEKIAEVAVGTVDQIFQRFAGDAATAGSEKEFAASPAISSETAEMLEDLLPFYDEMDRLSSSDGRTSSEVLGSSDGIWSSDGIGTPQLQQSTVGAQSAVAELHFNLGHYQRTIDTLHVMLENHSDIHGDDGDANVQLASLRNRLGFAFRMLGDDDAAEKEHRIALSLLKNEKNEVGLDEEVGSQTGKFELARTYYLLAVQVLPGMGPTAMPTVEVLRSTRFNDFGPFSGVRPLRNRQNGGAHPDVGSLPPALNQDAAEAVSSEAAESGQASVTERRPEAGRGPDAGRGPGAGPGPGFVPRHGPAGGPFHGPEPGGGPPRNTKRGINRGPAIDDGRRPPPHHSPFHRAASARGERSSGPGQGRRISKDDVKNLQLAIGILRELIEEDPDNLSYSLSLARSLRQLEHDARFRPASADSMDSRESVELLRDLKDKHPKNQTILFELSETLADHQLIQVGEAGFSDGIMQLAEAADTFTQLCELHPNVPKYVNAMVHTHFKLAMLLELESQRASQQQKRELKSRVKDSLQRSVDGYAVQVQMHPDACGYRAWYALFLYQQGKNLLGSGFNDQAIGALQESVDQWNRVIESKPDEGISWRALPDVYRSLGQALETAGRAEEAKNAFDMAAMSQQLNELGR